MRGAFEELQMKKIAAIIVTYNRKDLLAKCIEALISQENRDCDIIVVDNYSTDGTGDTVRSKYKEDVLYYNTGANIGGAGGFNYGIKKAFDLGYKYFWLMDDDCIVEKDSLNNILAEAKRLKGRYGFLCSRVLWKDDSLCRMNIPKISYFKKIQETDTETTQVMMATFVSFFISRKIVEQVGLPIKDFFIWADDLEYSRRISRRYPCFYVYDSVVKHFCKSNIGSNLPRDDSSDLSRYSYAYRNEYYVYQREGMRGQIYYFIKRLFHKVKILFFSNRKMEKIRLINNAVKEAKDFCPEIEYLK